MAIFNYINNAEWDSYAALDGGTVTDRTVTLFRYVSADGFTITLQGRGFVYDADGIATAGTVSELRISKAEDGRPTQYAEFGQLATPLVDVQRLALGLISAAPGPVPTDIDALYALMRTGDDVYNGSNFGRVALGYDGDDTLYGNGGDDWLAGGKGVDTYYGGDGFNGLTFAFDSDATEGVSINFSLTTGQILNDGYGNTETLEGNAFYAFTRAEGGAYADHFVANFYSAAFFGLGGNDTLVGGRGIDTLSGGAGIDQYDGGSSIDVLSFSDVAGPGRAVIVNLGLATGPNVGNDGYGNAETAVSIESVFGSARSDRLTGDARANTFWGQLGDDILIGGAGADSLYGGDGGDRLFGGNGGDQFQGLDGIDFFAGGDGVDMLVFWDIVRPGHGAHVDLSLSTSNVLDDGFGNVETAKGIEFLGGSNMNDVFVGSGAGNAFWGERGNDRLFGGNGKDTLYGGYDDDRLYGGAGADTLIGGFGTDTISGGDGADVFAFSDLGLPGHPGDHIADFWVGIDSIVLNSASMSIGDDTFSLLQAGFLAGAGQTVALTASQIVIYDTATGNLYYDSDGVGGGNATMIATFDNRVPLTHDLFTLSSF